MNKASSCIFTLLLTLLPLMLAGQTRLSIAEGPEPHLRAMDEAFQRGELTADQHLLQKFLLATTPERVMEPFREGADKVRFRCLTPLLMEYEARKEELQPETQNEIEALAENVCSRPDTDFTHTSESGRFRFYYSLEGPHAVPSHEYVEEAAFAADSSWNQQIGRLGFADPVTAPQLTPYEIYFKDFLPYGVTCSLGLTSYIILNNSYEEGFPPNEHPQGNQIGALFVSVAHELKHASQYETNPSAFGDSWFDWIEMDAVMMEEEVFDDVNDYYHYIKSDGLSGSTPSGSSIFGNPEAPTPGAYEHATWMLYFAETIGMEFWVNVWERIGRSQSLPFLEAIRRELTSISEDFGEHHIRNITWHQASGPGYATDSFGFEERDSYPNPAFSQDGTIQLVPDTLAVRPTLQPLAARFYRVQPSNDPSGQVRIRIDQTQPETGIGLTAYFRDGSSDFEYRPGDGTQTELLTEWRWRELRELGIAIVNYSSESPSTYQLRIEQVSPEELTLSQNYPNPFYPTTRIRFGVERPGQVRLEIYDLMGRRVQTLENSHVEAGFHEVRFDGRGLASGVYFYQIVSGGESRARKMLLVR
ncbi:MAG: MXAN_6640 family putative metalloprotease [Balneolaceae bacterium]